MSFTKTHETLKYHLVITVEQPLTVKTIDGCARQDLGRVQSCLLSVTHMLCVNQFCHGVGRCVIDGSCSSSLGESQWTVLMGYLTISTNVRRYQTHHR